MAVNSRTKRVSAVQNCLPWRPLPFPDAWGVNMSDRKHGVGLYVSFPMTFDHNLFVVAPEPRVFEVPAEERTFVIPAEQRVFVIPAEERIFVVPAEPRIFVVED
jgi:hypothetical protein